MNVKKINDKTIKIILFVLIGILACFTRIYRIMEVPSGLNIDEAGMTYDAWCIANYGVDRHLISWPLWLINYGDGQSPLYCYLCILLFKIFGFHYSLIRIPAIVFSLINVLFSYLITDLICKETKDKLSRIQRIALPALAFFVVTICPCFIMLGRFGLDCNLLLGASTAFIYFFIKSVNSEEQKNGNYICAGIAGGLMLYTYSLSHLMLPLFLILSIIYLICKRKINIKGIIMMLFVMFILAIPAILEHVVNLFNLGDMKIGIFTIPAMKKYRVGEFRVPSFDEIKTLVHYIFIGDIRASYTIPGIKNMYSVTIPLFLLGLIGLFVSLLKKDRRSYGAAYVLFWFISSFVISSLIEINVTRINAIFFSVAFIAVYGMYCIWVMTEYLITKLFNTEFAKKIAVWVTILSILFATAVYAKNFSFFARYYYGGQYEKEYAWLPLFEPAVDEAIAFLEENPEYKGSSCHTSAFDCVLALALKMSPYEFDRLEENEYWNPLSFPAVEPGMSFIMSNTNVDYMNRLRNGGYSEYDFGKYTIFYWNK